VQTVNIIYWEEQGGWIGYLQEYPDYWTQGETLDDLKAHLNDLQQELRRRHFPGHLRIR